MYGENLRNLGLIVAKSADFASCTEEGTVQLAKSANGDGLLRTTRKVNKYGRRFVLVF